MTPAEGFLLGVLVALPLYSLGGRLMLKSLRQRGWHPPEECPAYEPEVELL